MLLFPSVSCTENMATWLQGVHMISVNPSLPMPAPDEALQFPSHVVCHISASHPPLPPPSLRLILLNEFPYNPLHYIVPAHNEQHIVRIRVKDPRSVATDSVWQEMSA